MTSKPYHHMILWAAFSLPFSFSAWAEPEPEPQQEIVNPLEQQTFDDNEELPDDVTFSEWRLAEDPAEEDALTIYEPMYFVVGGSATEGGDVTARFQISFKYRMFSEDGAIVDWLPWLEKFHLGYTQTSLWNLTAESKPFEDTNYKPSFFWEFSTPQFGWKPDYWRFGYEHESNGQAEATSRSIDMLFVQPAWAFRLGDEDLVFSPKFYTYLNRGDENEDIIDFRGRADITVRYGSEDSFLASMTTRYGLSDKGSLQLDLSYPIRQPIFSRAGGYIYLQIFHGYGESLVTYNQKEDLNVRLGFAIVR